MVVSVFIIADRAAHGFRWKTVIIVWPGASLVGGDGMNGSQGVGYPNLGTQCRVSGIYFD